MNTITRRLSQKYPEEMTRFDELLRNLEASIPGTELTGFASCNEAGRFLGELQEGVRRSRKEFDALLFFAACFGMLKSGKSTLVNLLAGHTEASPTRYGHDTTQRPCLILAGKRDEVAIFEMKSSAEAVEDPQMEKRCFNAVIDHLRGVIESEEELSSRHQVTIRKIEFTSDNVFKALCTSEGFGNEPLITVVRLEEASDLLKSDIALLDVPGLDSDKTKTDIHRYADLLDRCDLLLFIQSTISVLNHDAGDLLRGLVKRTKGSPIWLIQNRFEAQEWRYPEDVAKRDADLAEIARKELGKSLGVEAKRIFTKQVNLGKAYDAFFRPELIRDELSADELSIESKFLEVKDELSNKINEERLDIQLGNCLTQMDGALQNGRSCLRDLELWISSEVETLFAFRPKLDRLIGRFKEESGFVALNPGENEGASLVTVVKRKIEGYANRWKSEVVNESESAKREIRGGKVKGADFNREMDSRIDRMFNRGPDQIFALDGNLAKDLSECFREHVNSSASFTRLVQETREELLSLAVAFLDTNFPAFNPSQTRLTLNVCPEKPARVLETKGFFFDNYVEAITCHSKIDEAAKNLDAAIEKYVHRLSDEEVARLFRDYRDDQVAAFFVDQLRTIRDAKEADANAIRDELLRIREAIPTISKELKNLEDFTQKFRSDRNLPTA